MNANSRCNNFRKAWSGLPVRKPNGRTVKYSNMELIYFLILVSVHFDDFKKKASVLIDNFKAFKIITGT